jgi:hypothetical protein
LRRVIIVERRNAIKANFRPTKKERARMEARSMEWPAATGRD